MRKPKPITAEELEQIRAELRATVPAMAEKLGVSERQYQRYRNTPGAAAAMPVLRAELARSLVRKPRKVRGRQRQAD